MNIALNCELFVESWAGSGVTILVMIFSGSEHLSVWGLLNSELAGCLTSYFATRFTSRLLQPLLWSVCCFVFALVGACLVLFCGTGE